MNYGFLSEPHFLHFQDGHSENSGELSFGSAWEYQPGRPYSCLCCSLKRRHLVPAPLTACLVTLERSPLLSEPETPPVEELGWLSIFLTTSPGLCWPSWPPVSSRIDVCVCVYVHAPCVYSCVCICVRTHVCACVCTYVCACVCVAGALPGSVQCELSSLGLLQTVYDVPLQ